MQPQARFAERALAQGRFAERVRRSMHPYGMQGRVQDRAFIKPFRETKVVMEDLAIDRGNDPKLQGPE